MKLRVLMLGGLVPWHPDAGGGQIIAYETAGALAEGDQDVHYRAVAPDGYQRQASWGPIETSPKPPSLTEAIPLARRLARSRTVNDYDIVHVHQAGETFGYCLAYAMARRMGLRPKFVMSIYAPRTYAFPRSLAEVVTALSCQSANLLFCLSEFSKRDISRAYHVPLSKLAVTSVGVHPSFTTRQRPDSKRDRDMSSLFFSGRLNGPHEQKGLDVLLKSLPLVLRQQDVVLNIIGTGPRLPQYQQLARQLGISQHVRFPGFVEHHDMPRHYQQADLFVLPSRRESFGLVLAEAMACGLPVVATSVGAIPEVVENGVTGLLVPPDDPEALAGAINSLLSDPRRMQAMGARGAQRVRERFTWDRVAQRVLDGYHSVL